MYSGLPEPKDSQTEPKMRQQQRKLQTLRVSNIMHAELLWIELCTDIIGRTKEGYNQKWKEACWN